MAAELVGSGGKMQTKFMFQFCRKIFAHRPQPETNTRKETDHHFSPPYRKSEKGGYVILSIFEQSTHRAPIDVWKLFLL